MDAFFASVEQRDNPALRGKPIAVTGGGERTVITTSSYEARAYGVKTAMTLFQEEDREKKAALTKAVDSVNDKFGEHAVTFASTITQEKEQRVISPAWRPSGVRKSDA